MEPIVSAQNLNFTYNKNKDNEYQALINISLDIYPEEYIIIFGPSGCGKSTLLNVIAGLERPDSGTIQVFNKDLLNMNKWETATYHRTQVGMVYQQYNLITSLTVMDNVALPQIFVNVRRGKRNKWAKQLLERFGILKQAYKIPTELSGGQQQRIGIARAIVNNPKMVLADEPVGNLDSVSAKNVLEILTELNEKEKKTVIMVTHNPENLIFADRIIYMKDGIITREVINKNKNKRPELEKKKPKSPTAEISDLMRAYHGLSPEQINILIMPYKAKVFANHFISSRNMEETKIFEDVIQRRLLGTISQDELYDILKRTSTDGGVGFDRRTAEKVLRRINRVIRMAYYVYQKGRQRTNEKGEHDKISNDEKAGRLTDYLLKTCYYEYYRNLDEVQVNRLQAAVLERLVGEIQKEEFYRRLDEPFNKGGVGLNSKTAKALTEEIELILILGFGIVQMVSSSKSNDPNSDIEQRILKDNEIDDKEFNKSFGPENEDEETGAPEGRKDQVNALGGAGAEPGAQADNDPEPAENKPSPAPFGQVKSGLTLQDAILEAQEKEEKIKHKDFDIKDILGEDQAKPSQDRPQEINTKE